MIFLGIILLLYHLDANVTVLQRNVSIKLSTDIGSELLLDFEEIISFEMGKLTIFESEYSCLDVETGKLSGLLFTISTFLCWDI